MLNKNVELFLVLFALAILSIIVHELTHVAVYYLSGDSEKVEITSVCLVGMKFDEKISIHTPTGWTEATIYDDWDGFRNDEYLAMFLQFSFLIGFGAFYISSQKDSP